MVDVEADAEAEAGVEVLPPRSPAPQLRGYEDMILGGVRLTVDDVLPLLRTQYAMIGGGRTRDGRPILTFPAAGAASGLSDDEFQRLAFYLTSVPSMQEVDAGFVLVVDRRREKWSSVKSVLCQVSGWFPGLVHVVYVLRPAGFLQKAISEVSNKLFKEEFKFRVIVCGSAEELHQHVDRNELTADLGGQVVYSHEAWIQQRIFLEKFSSTTRQVSAALDDFTARLQADEAEKEEEKDVEGLGRKLHTQGLEYLELKEGILDAARCGEDLLKEVRQQEALSERACVDNVTSVERLLVQLEETERTFDEFWHQHSARLKQTMELCTFERSFRERRAQLSAHIAVVSEFPLTGETVEEVDALVVRLSGLREVVVAEIEQTEEVVGSGQQLGNGRHYVCLDSVRPSCQVLQQLCCQLTELLDEQTMMLSKYRDLQERIKHANDWCTGGAELVALHAKCPPEKAEQRRQELLTFLANGKDLQATSPEEFHPLDQKDMTVETRAAIIAVVERMAQVRMLVDRQLALLKRLSLKVAHRSSVCKQNVPANTHMESNRRPKSLCESDSSLSPGGDLPRAKQGHILAELLSTEQVYVSELGSIIRGYKHELENDKYQTMIPPLLHGKSEILFGNLEQIHAFHSEVFLPDLQNCVSATELVAMCFTQNQDKFFQLYSAYCQNIPRSEALRDSVAEANLFFQACQMKLGHKLPLAAYLLKPVQRITKYQLLLKDLAESNDEKCSPCLREALDCMLLVLKCVNDSMHQVAITGFWGDLSELGPLLLQGQFSVWTESKKDRLRDLRLKPMQRHIFFYQKAMLFCKKLVNNKATYHFKRSLKTSQIGLTESVKGDPRKFEVWLQGRQEVYTIQASTVDQTKQWVSEIKRVLLEQLRELKGEKIRQYSLVQVQAKPALRQAASPKSRSMSLGESNGSRSASTSTCASEEEAESSEYSVSEDEDTFSERTFDGGRYVSLADYSAIGRSEVSMNEGEEVELLKVGCAGWWFVRVTIDAADDAFWDQLWSEHLTSVQDVFTLVPASEVRMLREEAPNNLATLCYKAVEKIVRAVDNSCRTQHDQQTVLNCCRLLTRVLPYIFEDPEWRTFFWSSLPSKSQDPDPESSPLAVSLLNAICDLLFCPDFTVTANRKSGPDKAEDLQAIDSCEYIWAAGVGFAHSPPRCPQHDANRTELLKLLLTCFSETIYQYPAEVHTAPNRWIQHLTSADNRHALPLFTSLLNTLCSYDPVGLGVPYNHLIFSDSLEPLVDVALQILIVTLDYETSTNAREREEGALTDNLFVNYLSRIHRDEDFQFMLRGLARLLNNPLTQTYLPNSTKKIQFHQELLVLFWKTCDYNKKFMYYVLKSSDVLDVLVPILYHLNDSRADQSRVGLMHIGVFILLLLSGERNFGVRLNKPYTATIPMDIPVFSGTHGDLLVTVFHKVITTGHQRLQPLFDCLLTILVNVSPYLKTLSMVASNKLLHLLEAFSTPWFLYSAPNNHQLVFFLLEIFNNIIQYQFDGNSNLVYTIIRKRQVFHALASLPADYSSINKSLNRRSRRHLHCPSVPEESRRGSSSREEGAEGDHPGDAPDSPSMEGSRPAQPAEPGTLKVSLPDTPGIEKMTERESAHPATSSSVETPFIESPPTTTSASSSRQGDGIESVLSSDDNSKIEADIPSCSKPIPRTVSQRQSMRLTDVAAIIPPEGTSETQWVPSAEWVHAWKAKLPLQTIMRLLQVLVPQVEKICIDKGLTDESEILKFLQHGTLVGLLPVPHPILIRKYQANAGTTVWFRTYMWGVIYLRNVDPPIWYDTVVKLFEIQRV